MAKRSVDAEGRQRVPRMTRFKFAVTADNELYMAELKKGGGIYIGNNEPWSVFVYKFDKANLVWEKWYN